ncbi:MAG: GTP 3',8-cyclase MoaA [Rhodocyclaceae bacterium]|jgi:cyclic pyranopterin phosphate synthase|nr:GTP 3',8-cyclase MoaA [Rhodocyclaceae bacterium]
MFLDPNGRSFQYLRLSITDVCNYRCSYCLPNGYVEEAPRQFLTPDEIRNLVTGFAGLGLWKVRLTGGEPTVRKDFSRIAATISAIPGIRKVATTTNGYQLEKQAQLWRDAGIDAINVSIDSLNRANFHRITGMDHLPRVLAGIDAAERAGFNDIKINTVLLKGLNDHELGDFLAFVRNRNISLRFIELMETGDNQAYFKKHHLSANVVIDALQSLGWSPMPRAPGAGPAQVFSHPNHAGKIGIIAPYAKDFCTSCNRLRVTARGDLRLCLFGESGHNLRSLLQSPDQIPELQHTITSLLQQKSATHLLHFHKSGATKNLSALGG